MTTFISYFYAIVFLSIIPICYILIYYLCKIPISLKEDKKAFFDYHLLVWLHFYLLLSNWIAHSTLYDKIYPYTIPFLASIILASFLTILNRIAKEISLIIIFRGVALLGIFIFYLLLMHSWPGGDDGGGIGMVSLIGPGAAVNLILGIRSFFFIKK